ncbi:hypothetical protein GY45DRAFT_1406736 [Cubamyces sp. BRFM 1775]|nr:hypothetical protein GY45DRAFT_1406736 [Cubamyces sp. BRFM 1775]
MSSSRETIKQELVPATIHVMPVAAMPDPKDKKAPRFRGRDVLEFVQTLEHQAKACGVETAELPSYVLRYCSSDVKSVLVDEQVFSGRDWEGAKEHLITLYQSQTKKFRPSAEKLRQFVAGEQKKSTIRSLESLDIYRNEFAKRAGGLVKKKQMSEVERDLLFFQGLPEDVRLAITPTLLEEQKVHGKKLSRTEPPSVEMSWRAAHDYFDTDDINRIGRRSKKKREFSDSEGDDSTDSTSDSDSSTDRRRRRKKGKGKKKATQKRSKKSKKSKRDTVDETIQQLTSKLQGLTTLLEKGSLEVTQQRYVSPPVQPVSNSQVPFFPSQHPPMPSNAYTSAVGFQQERKKCYMCGKVEGADLDHRFGFKWCPETEKLIYEKVLTYSATDGKLMKTDRSPLPQFNSLGQGGLALYLRRELAQKGWQRDPPPHQAACMSLGLCCDDEPVFSYDKSTGSTAYDAYAFPAVTRSKAKEQDQTDASSTAQKESEKKKGGDKLQQKGAYVPHVSNTEEGRRVAQQDKRQARIEEIPDEGEKDRARIRAGAKPQSFRFTSDLQESVAVENLQEQILNTKVTLTLREVLAMSPQLQKRLQTLTRTRREFDTKACNASVSWQEPVQSLPVHEPGAASVTFATGEDLEELVVRYADAVVLGNARLFAMASGMVEGVFGDQKVRFLVDSGSELNLISRATWERANLTVDRDGSRWSLRGLGGENVPLIGCCRDAPVQVGGKNFDHHFFVSETDRPQYDGILGQPWLAWYSASIQYTRGGPVHLIAYPSGSLDGAFARVLICKAENPRNADRLVLTTDAAYSHSPQDF